MCWTLRVPMTPSFPRSKFCRSRRWRWIGVGTVIVYLLAALAVHARSGRRACMHLPVLAMVPNVAPAGKAQPAMEVLRLAGTRV
jgi:hypothetical protein